MKKNENYFEPINFIDLSKTTNKEECPNIPESDLTVQAGDKFIQYKFIKVNKEIKKTEVIPGIFTFVKTQVGISTAPIELKETPMLKSITNTKVILDESDKFFSRLHIYEKLDRPKKRAVMLHSIPGLGKSVAINEVCSSLSKEDGVCVLFWDTCSIGAGAILDFFSVSGKFTDDVKKVILVIEDIGGVSVDGFNSNNSRVADGSMLALLDGNVKSFTKPIFILATTNSPEIHASAMLRPGRFDKVIKLEPPNKKEVKDLIKFIAKIDKLDESHLKAVEIAHKNEFSIAHLQEIVIRSLLDDISMAEVAKQLADFKKLSKSSFVEMGAGIGFKD